MTGGYIIFDSKGIPQKLEVGESVQYPGAYQYFEEIVNSGKPVMFPAVVQNNAITTPQVVTVTNLGRDDAFVLINPNIQDVYLAVVKDDPNIIGCIPTSE